MTENKEKLSLGIDIGTSTVCVSVYSVRTGNAVEIISVPNDAAIISDRVYDKRQDAERIFLTVSSLLEKCTAKHKIDFIGITGQMHGIVYVGRGGELLSPLYTWEDGRGNLEGESGKSISEELREASGCAVCSGYGLVTHAYLSRTGEVPDGAYKICTVMDYVAAKICKSEILMHATNAASLGFFDVKRGTFDRTAISKAGIDVSVLPEVTTEREIIGTYHGIPVTVAIGDNQACVLGSVGCDDGGTLVNFGTGAQISVIRRCTDALPCTAAVSSIEVRPFVGDKVIVSGSALCGGRAYAMAERFFRLYAEEIGCGKMQYEAVNALAKKGIEKIKSGECHPLVIDTTFCGTRDDPAKRGRILNIGEDNFSPEMLLAGILYGMAGELHGMFEKIIPCEKLIGAFAISGNAARKNPALIEVVSDVFGKTPEIPHHTEEASYGAALFAAGQFESGGFR